MLRLSSIVAIVLATVLFTGVPALAEPRIALVIGNADYRLLPPLANPSNDATLVAQVLGQLGFDVTLKTDVSQKDMKRAIRDFGQKLRQSPREAVGLFYYAGHGVQAYGRNYLIPIGAPVRDESDLDIETINASGVLRQMESAGNAVNILILDACRNNPFRGLFRSTSRGLGRMEAPRGSLVAFSADHQTVALDGSGPNSPYTEALVQTMTQPGLPIEQVFKEVREKVEIATGGQQFPVEENRLKGDFYFVAPPAASAASGAGQAQTAAPAGAADPATAPGVYSADKEAMFWQAIEDSQDPDDYRAYLQSFPAGVFAPLARARLEDLEEDVAVLQPVPEQPVLDQPAVPSPVPEQPAEPDAAPAEEFNAAQAERAILDYYNAREAFSRAMLSVHDLEVQSTTGDVVTVQFRYRIKAYASTVKTGSPVRRGEATLKVQGSTYEVTRFKER